MFKNIKNKKYYIFITMLFFTISIYMIGVSREIETYDYWWHIKTGEYIYNQHKIPTKDIFSWYGISNNLNWTSHEWLSELLLYVPYKLYGQASGYIVSSILFILIGAIIYCFNKDKYRKNLVFSLLWSILGVVIMMPIFNPRPHMFSFILFLVTLKIILNFVERENYKLIWIIPIISILWGNLHGGSSNLPYILCLMAFVASLIEKKYKFIIVSKLSKSKLKTLLIVSCLSIIFLACNPHGFEIVVYPYVNMADSLMMNVIQEWRAPDLKLLNDYPIYILMFTVYIILLKRSKDIKLIDLIYVVAFTFLTLKSVRFSPFLYAVSTYIIFNYIEEKNWNRKVFSMCLMLLSTVFFLMNIPPIKENYNYFNNMKLVESSLIEDIKTNNIKKIYNAYDLGGYLIYKDIQPFIDGRADMYSSNILKDYHVIYNMILNSKELIERYDFDAFLVEKGSAIDNYISEHSSYTKISNSQNYNLYKKAD